MTRTAKQFVDELDTLHVLGEEDSVSDADGNIYKMQGCECGLGLGTPQDEHPAQMLERYVPERITPATGNNHTEILTRVPRFSCRLGVLGLCPCQARCGDPSYHSPQGPRRTKRKHSGKSTCTGTWSKASWSAPS
jgi:hypothetical protein